MLDLNPFHVKICFHIFNVSEMFLCKNVHPLHKRSHPLRVTCNELDLLGEHSGSHLSSLFVGREDRLFSYLFMGLCLAVRTVPSTKTCVEPMDY